EILSNDEQLIDMLNILHFPPFRPICSIVISDRFLKLLVEKIAVLLLSHTICLFKIIKPRQFIHFFHIFIRFSGLFNTIIYGFIELEG
ncbi:hypothetical protein ACJX0J_024101, partial [Zea mays]